MNPINGSGQGDPGSPGSARQLTLWDAPSFDPVTRLKAAMRDALKACPSSRERVVSDMNELAALEGMTCNGNAQKVSEPLLDKWVAAGSTAYVIPLRFLPIFCKVVGSSLPMQAMVAPLGLEIIGGEEKKLLEWARAEARRRHLSKEAKRLAQEVGMK